MSVDIRRFGVVVTGMAGALLVAGSVFAAGTPFSENWTGATSPYFTFLPNGGSTIASNTADGAASDGKILQLTLPAFPSAGPGGGPNIQSTQLYGFGTYEARYKALDCSSQPNTGAITGFFTFVNDGTDTNGNGIADNSEIDFEILCAEPNVLWLTQWTDFQSSPLAMKRIFRELDLSTGTIRQTCYSEGYGACTQNLTGSGTEGSPSTITPIPGFNSGTSYYTYGWTWLSNRMTWYIINPANSQKIILWDYQGPTARITQRQSYLMFNAWHTNNWPPTTNASAIQQPSTPRLAKIDWMTYAAGAGTPTPTACTGCTPTATPRPTNTATPTPTLATNCQGIPAWVGGTAYSVGQFVTYTYQPGDNNPNPGTVGHTYLYKCVLAHQNSTWTPGIGGPSIWAPQMDCQGGGTSTPTSTPTTGATATRMATATATATTGATATRTSTATATRTATATTAPSSNRALGRPATSSSNETTTLTPNLAVDGNTGTRWASAYSDPQWLKVDLGSTRSINRVRLVWEAAYASAYQIQTSNDNATWTTIKTVTGATGGTQDWTGLSGSGRYVRMYGTARGTAWGYSLWEFEVYGP